jgi:uncharacterized membrane protein
VTVQFARLTRQLPRRWTAVGAVFAATVVVGAWLWATPPGLLGKADAIGYAVCHRIAGRSFAIAGRPLPLCARCSGMYIGALIVGVMAAASGRARAAGLPPLKVTGVLLLMLALFGVDGLNSYLTFFPNAPHAYEPHNWMRLFSGMGAGLALGAFVLPSFNATLWQRPDPQPILGNLRELGALALVAAVVAGLILTEYPAVLYLLALAGSVAVLGLLAMIHVTLWSSLLRRANMVETWRAAALPLLAGMTLAVAQVAAIDALRYAVTGTWAGFAL